MSVINTLTSTVNILQKEIASKNVTIEEQSEKIKQLEMSNAILKDKVESLSRLSNGTDEAGVDKALSRSLKAIYKVLDDDDLFQVLLPYTAPHNTRVLKKLLESLKEAHPIKCETAMHKVIKQRFTNERKAARENSLPANTREAVIRKRRQTARRQNSYKTRMSTAIKVGKHVGIIKSMTSQDMTDMESDGETFICKMPPWRSEEEKAAIKELDSLITTRKKSRTYRSPSKRQKTAC